MTRDDVLQFVRKERFAVQASVAPSAAPQAAVIGIAVSDAFEIVFDTLGHTRKAQNLRANGRIALVIGGLTPGDERTVQLEGVADELSGSDRERLLAIYLQAHPQGIERLAWPGIVYVRVRPQWLRYSDYRTQPPKIVEFQFD